MANYQLRITLLSDTCVSDGGVYNSMIDTDCCYDELGFPFIPAKRIKGCLRECAMELNDWGRNIDLKALFGEPGQAENRGEIRFGNACLEGYEAMREEAETNAPHPLYHPQLILKLFTSIRTQTAISQETGVADPHSLRTMRTVNKGTRFAAELEMPDRFYNDLQECCAVFRHMGVARTRGFGEVCVTIEPSPAADGSGDGTHAALVPGADCLTYEITLKEPLICKSVAGGEARTQDFIEGSKLLGHVIGQVKNKGGQDAVVNFLNDKTLRFTNAYIGTEGQRYTEVPAYIYSIKNNKVDYVNRIFHKMNPEGIQLSRMKHCYVRMEKEDLYTLDVNVEDRYHHRRAEDKSIGRAVAGAENSDFYQMSSICAGQKFYGSVIGSSGSIQTVYNILTRDGIDHLGYSRSVEYGSVSFRVTATKAAGFSAGRRGTGETCTGRELLVKLEAPAIIYNRKAMCTVDKDALLDEVLYSIGLDKNAVGLAEIYADFTTVGGFNVTWDRRKPTIPAFDKGTSIYLKLDQEAAVPSFLFIGERSMEGYGEASVCSIDNMSSTKSGQEISDIDVQDNQYFEKALACVRSGKILSPEDRSEAAPVTIGQGSLSAGLADRLFTSYLGTKAGEAADRINIPIIKCRPTISNMLVGFRDYKDISEVWEMVEKRYGKRTAKKEEKLAYAQEIMKTAESEFLKSKSSFCREYQIEEWDWTTAGKQDKTQDYQMVFLEELLIAIKQKIRSLEKEKKSEGSEG